MAKKAATDTEKIDRELAWAAQVKRHDGQRPTRDELAALRRVEKLDEEERRLAYFKTISKKHWREMSGRQATILNDQAARYGIPVGGRIVDLFEVARWVHDFLAKNAHALNKSDASSNELERLRREKADEAAMKNKERRGELRHIEDVRRTFEFIANVFRKASSELRHEFGDRAYEILAAAVDEAVGILEDFEDQAENTTLVEG